MIIETNVTKLRDPYVVVADGVYYAYGTSWKCYVNRSGRLDGDTVFLDQPVHAYTVAAFEVW